jgi:hypothetical protein
MGTETNPLSEEHQEDLFIKLLPERRTTRYQVQVSDDPNDLPPPPLTPAYYNAKESENG